MDVCRLIIEGNIKSVFKHLPVMITSVIEQEKKTIQIQGMHAVRTFTRYIP